MEQPYHAQQCAEKCLKALLVFRKQAVPKTHDLVALATFCLQVGIIIPVDTKILQRLSTYSAKTRYPGDDPTPDEAKEAFEIAKSVRKFAKRLL